MSRSSDSESDSSTSSEEEQIRRHKRNKKHKHKEEKKQKKHSKKKSKKQKIKKRKRSTSSSGDDDSGPVIPPRQPEQQSDTVNCEAFGPALPPHLLKKANEEPSPSIIGPILPSTFVKVQEEEHRATNKLDDENEKPPSDSDEDDGMFGPMPQDSKTTMSSTQIELEERALALKLAAIDKDADLGEVDQKVREEWMLELPEVGLKGGLAALNNLKRTLGKERPDFSDRSSWTKTPQSKESSISLQQQQEQQPSTSKDLAQSAKELYERQRDEEQERIAKKHKKKHKRDESLVAMHQKKLRKEQKKKEKELAAAGAKPERRPFSRDIDLKLNKIDSHQTKQIVDKAKILNTKFSSGQSKYL